MQREGVIRIPLSGLGATTRRDVEIPVLFEGTGLAITLISASGRPYLFHFHELPAREGGEPGVLYFHSVDES